MFAGTEDQRFIQKSSVIQICNQGRVTLIKNRQKIIPESREMIRMRIPH